MSDPLASLTLALAARGGRLDAFPAARLVAAGITLLTRCAPLVRALSAGRGAILLPPSPALLVALAACEGRGALLLDSAASADALRDALRIAGARVVFTTQALAPLLQSAQLSPIVVLLDDAPARASVAVEGVERVIDLGSHYALALEGNEEADGRDDECLTLLQSGETRLTTLSHRDVLAAFRHWSVSDADMPRRAHDASITEFGQVAALLAPLMSGETVTTAGLFYG